MVHEKKFKIIKIKNKTVGDILSETRREFNISLEEASQKTRIHQNYLKAIEEGEYALLPGGVYSEKILQTYADFLNIDFNFLKKLFIKETQIINQQYSGKTFVPKVSKRNFLMTPRLIKIFVGIVLITLLLIYLGYEIYNIFSPPALDILSPTDNLITTNLTIKIIGQTEKEVQIKINDQAIQSDKDGFFQESVSLKPGLNIVKISAAKKRGKENIIYRRVILMSN